MVEKKHVVLAILSLSVLFALTLWFSANAVVPQLTSLWDLSASDISLLSLAVIVGFVSGGLLLSFFNIPDVVKSHVLFAGFALAGSVANFVMTLSFVTFPSAVVLRFLIGFFLAGVYPSGMKLAATWFKKGRGFAIGVVLGALTLGSGLPYIFNLTGLPDWRFLLNISTVLALLSAVLVFFFVREGPFKTGVIPFSTKNVMRIVKEKSVRLSAYGYFGHMWELYAMWVWVPLMIKAAYETSHPGSDATLFFSLAAFGIFCFGAISTVVGGFISDRIGRTRVSIVMLCVSGASAVLIGFAFPNPVLVVAVAIVWGIAVIPDSPQYSAMITELLPANLIGTALTLQTAIGFLITIFSIRLIPFLVQVVGWEFAFVSLVFGPIFGVIALFRLRKLPESKKIAGGKK